VLCCPAGPREDTINTYTTSGANLDHVGHLEAMWTPTRVPPHHPGRESGNVTKLDQVEPKPKGGARGALELAPQRQETSSVSPDQMAETDQRTKRAPGVNRRAMQEVST